MHYRSKEYETGGKELRIGKNGEDILVRKGPGRGYSPIRGWMG